MASAHQPHQQQQNPPTNPFDGFDAYTAVAAPPPVSSLGPLAAPQPKPQPYPQFQQPVQQQQVGADALNNLTWTQPQPATVGNPFDVRANFNQGAIVQSNTPSNPYALSGGALNQSVQYPQLPQPFQQQQQQQQAYHQQQMVHVGNAAPWSMAPNVAASGGGGSMPPPTPARGNQQLVTAPQSDDPFGIFASPVPHPPQPPQQPPLTPQQNLEQQMQSLQFSDNTPSKQSIMPDDDEEEGLALVDVELEEEGETHDNNFEEHKQDGEFIGRNADKKELGPVSPPRRKDRNADIAPPPPMPPGRENAEYLSRNAGGMTSPLPRPSLVVHSGYVLSRISFRTVLLRKWKQTFWIQYGPTQLLFFRTFADFEDWLNNPYHTIKAREYLVKLRVDFVSDLKKKSVMGYQVTQIRRKPYGTNVMLHFKLERWMDYGPTIAAAFAARQEEMIQSPYYNNSEENASRLEEDGGMNTTNDVSALRKIILGCMRNARDAALVASQERVGVGPRMQPEYQGRYAEDENVRAGAAEREVDDSSEKVRTLSHSSKAGLYHQAFAAESSTRRKYQEDEPEPKGDKKDVSQSVSNQDNEASVAAVTQIVDLLG